MAGLHRELASGATIARALHTVQLAAIATQRRDGGPAHWSSFRVDSR
jgi:hypothetical protein